MSQKYLGVIVIIVFLIGVALLTARRKSNEAEMQAVTVVPAIHDQIAPPEKEAPPPPVNVKEKMPAKASVDEKIKNLKLATVDEYRQDVEANPHRPSPKALKSALDLGELFDAVSSETDARQALAYYKSCLGQDLPTAIQTACYRYSKKLAQNYPQLAPEFDSLNNLLNDEVRKVLNRDQKL